jgi:flagellar hook-basal body complex protein FliE
MIDPVASLSAVSTADTSASVTGSASRASGFGDLVMSGLTSVADQSAAASDALANYAVGNPVSPHELMIAMEQARQSLQLTVEIRNRLVESYQELTRMQI